MILTTNKSIRDWTELLATATLDRLLHRSHVLNIKGRSYRLRELEDTPKGRAHPLYATARGPESARPDSWRSAPPPGAAPFRGTS